MVWINFYLYFLFYTSAVDISGYISEKCHLINDNKKSEDPSELNNSTASIVVKSVPMYVHPEGIQHQTTDSAYFCANGNGCSLLCFAVNRRFLRIILSVHRATHRFYDVGFPVSTFDGAEESRWYRVRNPSEEKRSHFTESGT